MAPCDHLLAVLGEGHQSLDDALLLVQDVSPHLRQLTEVGEDRAEEVHLLALGVVALLAEDGDQRVHADVRLHQLRVDGAAAGQVPRQVGQDLCRLVRLSALLVFNQLERLIYIFCKVHMLQLIPLPCTGS